MGQKKHPYDACDGPRKRGNDDEGIDPGLEINHDEQVDEYDSK